MYTIEKNIPIGKNLIFEFPIREMQVGDSFLITCEPEKAEQKRINAMSKIKKTNNRERLNMKFTSKVLKEGVRIWRII